MSSLLQLLPLLVTHHTTSAADCSQTLTLDGDECASQYSSAIQPHLDEGHIEPTIAFNFNQYLNSQESDTNWFSLWEECRLSMEDEEHMSFCHAIQPIADTADVTSASACLCQLKEDCDGLCDSKLSALFFGDTAHLINGPAYYIDYDKVTRAQCQAVLDEADSTSDHITALCEGSDIYAAIQNCAQPRSDTDTDNNTPTPTTTTTDTSSPTVRVTTVSIGDAADSAGQHTDTKVSTPSPSTAPPTTPSPTTPSPVIAPSAVTTQSAPSTVIADTSPSAVTSLSPTLARIQSTDTTTDSNADTTMDWSSTTKTITRNTTWSDEVHAPSLDVIDTTAKNTSVDADASPSLDDNPAAHPMSNLLLVSLIIFGFCVFVAWYAKKHQHTLSGPAEMNGHDGGYLWGLNASDSKSANDGDTRSDSLSHDLTQPQTDLLAITPDHIGRLGLTNTKMQMRAPMSQAPSVPRGNKRQGHPGSRRNRKSKHGRLEEKVRGRRGQQPLESGSDSGSDESSGDMAAMREQYYASQTLGKKLADTLGDISDAAMSTARTVKRKMRLGRTEKTVVVPMAHRVRMKPFVRAAEEESDGDGFDLESDTESESEESDLGSDEFREEPATKVRMNVHGRRIKQPMALPTFEEEEDEESVEKKSKRKKKRKKDRKEKERKKESKVELTHANDGLMGFAADELEEVNNIEVREVQMDAKEVADTMQELEMELLSANAKSNGQKEKESDLADLLEMSNAAEEVPMDMEVEVEQAVDGGSAMVDAAEETMVLGNGTDAAHSVET